MLDGQEHVQSASDSSNQAAAAPQKWTLTQEAFDKLLLVLGSGDRESGSEKYLEIRTNLTRFFEWRGCSFPEDHADETINRMARKVVKSRQREQSALTEMGHATQAYVDSDDGENRAVCLRGCLQNLSNENRELILQYYQGEKSEKIRNRKWLMERLGIPVNTLRMRALRLRERLQGCVEECLSRA
jgi:hypothetical protein